VSVTILRPISEDSLTASEQVLGSCAIAREKLEIGDYEAGCTRLQRWWRLGEWPRLLGLTTLASAELLFVAGTLSGWVASSKQVPGGRKSAEALLSGSIAIFEQLDERTRAAEGRIELACCYYHQGAFDLARTTLHCALTELAATDGELRGVALIRLAVVERLAGRLRDALALLDQAASLVTDFSDWPKGRFHLEVANTLKEIAMAEDREVFFERAFGHYRHALAHFTRIGNHSFRATRITEYLRNGANEKWHNKWPPPMRVHP